MDKQKTPEITILDHSRLDPAGIRAFDLVRRESIRVGRELYGAYLSLDGYVYNTAVIGVGDSHSAPVPNILSAFHSHSRSKESPSGSDFMVALLTSRKFHRDDRTIITFGRHMVVNNYEIWSYAPTLDAARLVVEHKDRLDLLNVIYWSARIVSHQYSCGRLTIGNYRGQISNLDPRFTLYQLDLDPHIERTICKPHPDGLREEYGGLERFKKLATEDEIADLFYDNAVGFDVQRDYTWSDEIANMPARSDAGVVDAAIELAVTKILGTITITVID